MDYSVITGNMEVFKTGLFIGMSLAVAAGFGGMLIHYSAKLFKIAGGA